MNQEYQIFELEAKLKEEISGLEYEDEADDLGMDEIEGIPYCADDIRIDQKMFSLYQVFRWIQQGKLNLRPDFQRNFIWSRKKQSLLIESLMLKIPIPAFYFYENEENWSSAFSSDDGTFYVPFRRLPERYWCCCWW